MDLATVRTKRLAAQLDARPDWVVGGPPCQGFSTVGKRQAEDSRNGLIREFVRAVRFLRPEGVLIENVVGLRDMRFVTSVKSMLTEMGYWVSCHVLTSADYGIPQLRRRIIFVGHRDRGFFAGPAVTHERNKYVSVWDAIGDLPPLEPGEIRTDYKSPPSTPYQVKMRRNSISLQGHEASNHPPQLVRAIAFIPDGGNRTHIPARYQPRSGFHNSYSRLNSKLPAVAVTSNMGKPSATRCIHPFQDRGLTAREGARLQGFPDRYHFVGGLVSQRLQIANAVPPILAAVIGNALVQAARWSHLPEADGSIDYSEIRDLPRT